MPIKSLRVASAFNRAREEEKLHRQDASKLTESPSSCVIHIWTNFPWKPSAKKVSLCDELINVNWSVDDAFARLNWIRVIFGVQHETAGADWFT